MASKKSEISKIRRHLSKVQDLARVECGHECFIAETERAEEKLIQVIIGAMKKAHLAGWSRTPWEGWK